MKKIDFEFGNSGYAAEYNAYLVKKNVLVQKRIENFAEFGLRIFVFLNLLAFFVAMLITKTAGNWYYAAITVTSIFSGLILLASAGPYFTAAIKNEAKIKSLKKEFYKEFDQWFQQKTAIA